MYIGWVDRPDMHWITHFFTRSRPKLYIFILYCDATAHNLNYAHIVGLLTVTYSWTMDMDSIENKVKPTKIRNN